MKKIIYSLAIAVFFIGCSDSFLDPDRPNTTTDETVADLAAESPEALLNIASSFDVGTINSLRTFGVGGSGGDHNDFGQKGIDIMMDVMSNDMITLESNTGWFFRNYNYTGRIQEATATSTIWNYYYEIIKGSNQTIGLIGNLPADALTQDLKYVLARAKATRGYSYLSLIQIY
ncbi:RagB/SusD family nutrient uptake outer membrane protein [Polaribacter sp. IC073]|uniref:RagB/SusD family nutrient uptake outer membrane protein n=1 Tax=Polaribacter sp. IC073 TaxID=2508540 RepID=UPI0011BE9665|nr:RagB/SusD family nutrient uptake outer membrane protein [Polaribacter sp. IC073]TXD46629.1 RagB/SusD family nutrient uptake outer membrane protein [Polaribacter sp. IC073]